LPPLRREDAGPHLAAVDEVEVVHRIVEVVHNAARFEPAAPAELGQVRPPAAHGLQQGGALFVRAEHKSALGQSLILPGARPDADPHRDYISKTSVKSQ